MNRKQSIRVFKYKKIIFIKLGFKILLYKTKNLLIPFLVLFILSTCAPIKRHKILSFFFDGVPPLDTSIKIFTDTIINNIVSTTDSIVNTKMVTILEFIHPPYQEKECNNCHNKNLGVVTLYPQPDLCYQCHENISEAYAYVHGPLLGGYCTTCHHPHKAKLNKLLLRTGQQLCLHCHDATLIYNNEMHSDIETTDCTDCHNPHGGDNNYFIR